MKLITKQIHDRFVKDPNRDLAYRDCTVIAKFFTPDAGWTWYVHSAEPWDSGNDTLLHCMVVGHHTEFGDVLLSDLLKIRGMFNLPVERDRSFDNGKKMFVDLPECPAWVTEERSYV